MKWRLNLPTWRIVKKFFMLPCLVTGPSFMLISLLVLELRQFSFIKTWPEIRKSEIPKSEISGDWGQVWDTQFGVNVSNEMLLNAPKCQGYTFYRFWVKGKPTGGVKLPITTHMRVKCWNQRSVFSWKIY